MAARWNATRTLELFRSLIAACRSSRNNFFSAETSRTATNDSFLLLENNRFSAHIRLHNSSPRGSRRALTQVEISRDAPILRWSFDSHSSVLRTRCSRKYPLHTYCRRRRKSHAAFRLAHARRYSSLALGHLRILACVGCRRKLAANRNRA